MMNNIKKVFLWVVFFLITMTFTKQSFSENLIAPNEGFSAQEVVEIQPPILLRFGRLVCRNAAGSFL